VETQQLICVLPLFFAACFVRQARCEPAVMGLKPYRRDEQPRFLRFRPPVGCALWVFFFCLISWPERPGRRPFLSSSVFGFGRFSDAEGEGFSWVGWSLRSWLNIVSFSTGPD